MATWIGHLRIAEALLQSDSLLDPGYFSYGSLAPDCGRRSETDDAFVPPKEISHFQIELDGRPVFQDLIFYRKHLSEVDRRVEPLRYSFLLGYFVHLMVDGLWYEWIAVACQRDYADFIDREGVEAWWTMKDDWYGLDVHYAMENQHSLFWTHFVPFDEYQEFLPHQDSAAVADQMEYIKGLYTCPPLDLIDRDNFPWLSPKTMNEFVGRASGTVRSLLEGLGAELGAQAANSTLQLLPEDQLLPFEGPIGDGSAA